MKRSIRTCSEPRRRTLPGLHVLAIVVSLMTASPVFAADLTQAGQLVDQRRYQEAYDLLAPQEATSMDDPQFVYLLGRAALGTNNAERAETLFERALTLQPDSTDARLALGRAYYAQGKYAEARIEFETVLRYENLPPDLLSQAQIYDESARESLEEDKKLTGFGYAELGIGNYRVNSTRGTNALGGGDRSDTFYNARLGGGLNYALSEDWALDGTLDYRFRYYDNRDSRDDRDLRWSGAASHSFDDNNLAFGLRGRVSYRGDSDYRNDFVGFVDYSRRINELNQLNLGASVQRRRYPTGPLRARSRTTSQLSVGWVRSIADGKGSFSATAHGGRNTATSRPDGESDIYGATLNLDYTFSDTVDAFIFAWWEHDSFNTDRIHFHPDALDDGVILRREDNLYELGAGVIWGFAPSWSLRPEFLFIRDESNSVGFNYSSTEVWVNVRKSF